MYDNDTEKRQYQIKLRAMIRDGIQHFGMIIFVLAAALILYPSPITALILVECAYIFFRGFYYIFCLGDSVRPKIKGFIASVIPGAVAVVAVGILGVVFESDSAKGIIETITKIVAGIFIVPLIIPFLKGYVFDDKFDDTFIITHRKISSSQKLFYRLLTIFSRVLVLLGLALTIIAKPRYGLYFESVTIIGCVIWLLRHTLICYCGLHCEIIGNKVYYSESKGYYQEDCNEEVNEPQTNTDNGDRALNEREVKEIVRKIADRWSYKTDTFFMVAGVSIKYNVTFEFIGYSYINYTVNGKLSGVRENNVSEAHTYARGKIDDVAFKIKCETENELGKKNLSRSYDITVNTGYIE